MKGLSYTQRTLRELRQMGCLSAVVERFNRHAGPFGKTQDLFGFIDVIALDPARGIVGIQSTGPNGHSAHRKTILEQCNEQATAWLKAGGSIELWSWRKLKLKRGGKALRWSPRIETISLADFL